MEGIQIVLSIRLAGFPGAAHTGPDRKDRVAGMFAGVKFREVGAGVVRNEGQDEKRFVPLPFKSGHHRIR